MEIDFLCRVFDELAGEEAILWRDETRTYGWLNTEITRLRAHLSEGGGVAGKIVSLEGACSPGAIALLLALVAEAAIIVPLSSVPEASIEGMLEVAQVESRIDLEGGLRVVATGRSADHALYRELRASGHPGLVLFTSGTSGAPKAAVHDLSRLLRKFHVRRHRLRTLLFLLFDHIGGLDSLFNALSNGSALVLTESRAPDAICELVERHRVEVLPAAPSFLNMLLLSEAHRRYDLSSLRVITYGAEVMPRSTVARLAEAFPGVTLLQKYGLTEVGTLRSRSRSSDSVWVKMGGEGFQLRVVDGLVQIKAESAMLGYLNAPSPFTADGWLVTGDMVEVDGEYFRILGRQSDVVNVGGEKVLPAEVEEVILEVPGVADAAVYGEKNALLGQIVCARLWAAPAGDRAALPARVLAHCKERLAPYKVPFKIKVVEGERPSTDRQKKTRRE